MEMEVQGCKRIRRSKRARGGTVMNDIRGNWLSWRNSAAVLHAAKVFDSNRGALCRNEGDGNGSTRKEGEKKA